MVPVYREYIVDKYSLMTNDEFLDILAQAQSIPGPIALNTAIIVGRSIAGIVGMIVSAFSVIIPPFTVILIVSIFFKNLVQYKIVQYFLRGINIGITAVLIKMVYDFMKVHFKRRIMVSLIFLIAILIALFKVQAIPLFIIFATLLFIFDPKNESN